MDEKIKLFQELAELFEKNGHALYLVGGSVRDYLLNIPLTDMDLVTDATPSEEKTFLKDADYTFERFGSIKLKYKGVKFDITTLRKETKYLDSRHPSEIVFTDKLEDDVYRRDLTINALYLSKDLKVIDLIDGQLDLSKHLIRMVGDPTTRIKEDPLRIIRVYRFLFELGFEVEPSLEKAIKESIGLINKIRVEKIKEEIYKSSHKKELIKLLKESGINNL